MSGAALQKLKMRLCAPQRNVGCEKLLKTTYPSQLTDGDRA